MRVYVVTFQLDKYTDTLVFSSNEYLIRGLINYIKKASTKISRKMLKYFEEYQKKSVVLGSGFLLIYTVMARTNLKFY